MFQKSNNIDKLRELVEQLSIKDSDIIESKQLLELILETATDGYWDWNIKEGYEYLSPGFKSQLGYAEDEMENHPSAWQDLIFEEDLALTFEEVEKHFKSKGEYPFAVTARYNHKDGHVVTILCRGKVIEWDSEGNPVRMVGTHVDITDL